MQNFTAEELERFKQYERERLKRFYRERLAVKVHCPICLKQITQGALEKHQESRLCKPVGQGSVVRELTEKYLQRREYHKEYVKKWRERQKQNNPN